LDAHLRSSNNGNIPGATGVTPLRLLQQRAFEHYIDSDVTSIGAPTLPAAVSQMHLQVLRVPHNMRRATAYTAGVE
jgi:hypothetical protein